EVVKDRYNKYVYDKMGKAKMSLESYEEAIDCFNNIIDKEEESHQYIYRVAQCYEAMKIYDKALENYTNAIEEDVNNEVYYNSRGCLYATLKRYEESINDFEKAATLRDDVVQYKYNLALSYKEIGSTHKTIELYEKILEAEGDNEYILLTLGKLCINTENIEKANKCFMKIIEINKGNKEAYYYLGYIRYFENKFEDAIEYINISMDGDENESSLLLRARCYLESYNYKDAISDFSKLIDRSSIPDYYFYRGMAKASLKDYKGSVDDYTLAIEFDPNDGQMYISRGAAYKSMGKYKEAIQDYQRAGNVNYSLKGTAYYNIGMIYDITGDYKRALYYLNKSEKINPSSDNIDEINSKREEIYLKTKQKTS
ncbi:MAG: tetratricopeptide repeat protein, partial [Clostridium sp.]